VTFVAADTDLSGSDGTPALEAHRAATGSARADDDDDDDDDAHADAGGGGGATGSTLAQDAGGPGTGSDQISASASERAGMLKRAFERGLAGSMARSRSTKSSANVRSSSFHVGVSPKAAAIGQS